MTSSHYRATAPDRAVTAPRRGDDNRATAPPALGGGAVGRTRQGWPEEQTSAARLLLVNHYGQLRKEQAMTYTTCLECGELAEGGPHCREHAPRDTRPVRRDLTQVAWRSLSRRARAAQPWCQLCGSTERLAADHSPRAHARRVAGLPIRLCDVNVVCLADNNRLGSSLPGSKRYAAWANADGDLRATTPDPTLGGGGSAESGHPEPTPSVGLSPEAVQA